MPSGGGSCRACRSVSAARIERQCTLDIELCRDEQLGAEFIQPNSSAHPLELQQLAGEVLVVVECRACTKPEAMTDPAPGRLTARPGVEAD